MKALLQPSKQERSRATQQRILDATADLLRNESFESISVRQIVAVANTSIGSFYGRFRDKDALLPLLLEQSEQKLLGQIARLRRDVLRAGSVAEVAALLSAHLLTRYGDNPELSRAIFEYSMRAPNSQEAKELSDLRASQYSFLPDALLRFRAEISHPDPERAIELGLYFHSVTCRNRLFYPLAPQARTIKIGKGELKQELTELLTRYLTA